jgi:hypothetical protein
MYTATAFAPHICQSSFAPKLILSLLATYASQPFFTAPPMPTLLSNITPAYHLCNSERGGHLTEFLGFPGSAKMPPKKDGGKKAPPKKKGKLDINLRVFDGCLSSCSFLAFHTTCAHLTATLIRRGRIASNQFEPGRHCPGPCIFCSSTALVPDAPGPMYTWLYFIRSSGKPS